MASPDPVAAFIARWSQASVADLAKRFNRAQETNIQEILETIAALGRAHPGDVKGTFVR